MHSTLPDALADIAVRPGDAEYERVRHTYTRRGSPAAVFRVTDPAQVTAVLEHVRTHRLPLSVRSGGHGVSGRSTNDGGVVLDLSRMNRVTVLDADSGLVRVEAGARWGDVATALDPHGLALSSGDTGDVGVGGLATAGGLGLLARLHGLTIDRVLAVELVLADGRSVRADREHNPDLFWAVRGAGANFGVATAFEFRAAPLDGVVAATTIFDAAEPARLLARWGAAVEAAPREVTSFLTVTGTLAQALTVYAGTDTARAAAAMAPVVAAGHVLGSRAHLTRYRDLLPASHTTHRAQQPLSESRSGLLDHLSEPAAAALAGVVRSGVPIVQVRSVGGAVNDVPAEETAYAHRGQNFAVMAATAPTSAGNLDRGWDRLRPHLRGLYSSFETGTGEQRLRDAFPGPVLDRLRALKARYDPELLFNGNFTIPPAR